MSKALDQLKNVSEKDRKQIEQAEEMLGPDPSTMGFIKNLFWGRFREDAVLPYPEESAEERTRCDALLEKLDHYLRTEHPSTEIDQKQEIPESAVKALFDLGVMGMIIPQEYGGGGFGTTSYNRVLERIGRSCGSTAVMVSAHQSIGCGAINLFGNEEQKNIYLPRMAKDTLSAFCLSEPQVGCDAGGQETRCTMSEDGEYYILNGEKKWATSGALSGLFTVMCKQRKTDPKTGKEKDVVTALICTPDMEGIDIFSRNRSKCGIRGTWQARIRFNNVRVPKKNLLFKEGRGLVIALTCLNVGRCTLSAGMVGAAKSAFEQATKWAQYRYQFDRPIGDFEQVKNMLARMNAYVYAMDAMLYMTTGIVDRNDEDLMLETAACKVFCSEYGFRTVDDAVQIMGGEGYMTENTVERLWRDSRINIIVEGANEVMHSFIFGYGSKQLGESMLAIKANPFGNLGEAMRIAAELFLGLKRSAPHITRLNPQLGEFRVQVEKWIRDFAHEVKVAFKTHEEKLITAQMVQRRLSLCALWIHAMTCALSKLDHNIKNGLAGQELEDEMATVRHLAALAEEEISQAIQGLHKNPDASIEPASDVAMRMADRLPNSDFSIPESTKDKDAYGTGRDMDQDGIQQFGNGSLFDLEVPGGGVKVGS
ncbi:acyl-CoA dehydrogenase [Acidobacteria bacterium Mor1]|nr:acyl-CoA dehydrogenase [Acidobacteria bacterium Mor1]